MTAVPYGFDFYHPTFDLAIERARRQLVGYGIEVDAGRWQGHATEGDPSLITRELLDYKIHVPVDRKDGFKDLTMQLAAETGCNKEWADEHFLERVGGRPMNPDPSYRNWPWWHGQESSKQAGEQFTHTYSERFWPKHPVSCYRENPDYPENRQFPDAPIAVNKGVRYAYGDLNDLVDQLVREPMGRQAVLPIFFPEDTGAVHGGRVPCTLHYSFLMRDNQLHMWYPIRSCDFVRHMADDLYLACRLLLWVLDQCKDREQGKFGDHYRWSDVRPGVLHFTAYSLHYHKGDEHHVIPR